MKSQTKSLLRSSTDLSRKNKTIHDTLLDRYSQEQNPVLRDLIEFSSPKYNKDINGSSFLKEQTNKRTESLLNASENKSLRKSGSFISKGSLSGSKEYVSTKSIKNKENVNPEKQTQKNKSHKKGVKASLEYFSPKNSQGAKIRKFEENREEKIFKSSKNNDDFEDHFEASQSLSRANVMNFLKGSMSESYSTSQINDMSTKETFRNDKKVDETYSKNNLLDQLESSDLQSFVYDSERAQNKGFNMHLEYRDLHEQQLYSAPVSLGRESLYHNQSGLLQTEMLESYPTDRYSSQSEKPAKKSDLIKMIQSLKCQVQAKGLKLTEMKKKSDSTKIATKKVRSKLEEVCVRYQETENVLNKMKDQVQYQEDEVESLTVCVQKLEDNVKSNSKANIELKDYRAKVAMYEKLVEQKTKEALDLTEKLQRAEKKQAIPRKVNSRIIEQFQRLEEEIEDQENEITNIIQEIEEAQAETEGYIKTESKLGELENLQNYLMEENDNLREQIADEEEKQERLRIEMEESNLDIQDKLTTLCCKLKRLDENAKNLVLVVEAVVQDKEDQINLENGHNIDLLEDTLQSFNNLQLIKKVVSLTEGLQKKFTQCLEQVSETNSLQYQNECNQQ